MGGIRQEQLFIMQGKIMVFLILVTSCLGTEMRRIPVMPMKNIDPDFQNATLTHSYNTFTLTTKSQVIPLINLPDVRQATDYTCGPSAMQAILWFYGFQYREMDLADIMHADKEQGTSIFQMIKVPIMKGLNAEHHFNMTMGELEMFAGRGVPVIVLIQAWRGKEDFDKEWSELWGDGHYVVVIGVDAKYVYCEDPSTLGGIGYIPKKEFMDRWHDLDTEADTKLIHYGMTVFGKRSNIQTAVYIE